MISVEQDLLEPVFYRSGALDETASLEAVQRRAGGRANWVISAGGDETERILERLHRRGFVGPLWEFLIR